MLCEARRKADSVRNQLRLIFEQAFFFFFFFLEEFKSIMLQ